jgi:Domain of unknown function (DUF1929)/Divergent InlB B-repeat domain
MPHHSPRRLLAAWPAVLLVAVVLVAQGCEGTDKSEDTTAPRPELATTVTRTLTLKGRGTGSGYITATATELPDLVCNITAGTYLPEQCMANYPDKTVVTLTATPLPGSKFNTWAGSCTTQVPTCTVTMNVARTVTAGFGGSSVPTYALDISGSGTGSGTVTVQPPAPQAAVVCSITLGTASPTGCDPTFPSGTVVTISAQETVGTFDQWGGACTAAGSGVCTLTISATTAISASFTAPDKPEASVGSWDPPQSTPVIAVHLNELMSGKFLMTGHLYEPNLWDPVSGLFTEKHNPTCNRPDCDTWCGGHTFLADGRLLWAGGHSDRLGGVTGVKFAGIFDGSDWQPASWMTYARWYPTLTTLPNGDVVAVSGNIDPSTRAKIPERYNVATNTWVALTGASSDTWLYPRMFVEPKNGWIFHAGEQASKYLDPSGLGAWTRTGIANPNRTVLDRSYGSAVMLDTKVLYVGGGGDTCPTLPQNTAEIIDLAAATPTWTATASMTFRRRQMNATILPDGTVLAIGGTAACGGNDESGSVYAAELYTPASGGAAASWKVMSNMTTLRVYHSTSALLPDGRVLVSGSGDGGNGTQEFNYEIFSPPYLFKGPRPSYTLDNGTTTLNYGSSFVVHTPDAAAITKVTLIRLTSTTHAFDAGQRLNTLSFTKAQDGLSLTVTPPAAAKLAPPGPYMLFIIGAKGVPSVGQKLLLN